MTTDTILKDATDEQLGLAVQTNLLALFRAMTALPNSHIEETAKLSRHLTPPTNPMYKGTWGTNLAQDEVEPAIKETINWFKSRGAPFFFWWTGPNTQPENLAEKLMAHGLVDMAEQGSVAPGMKYSANGSPGMVADLHKMTEGVLERVPENYSMDDVRNAKDLQDFKQVLIEVYEIPEALADGWVQSANEFGIGKTPWRLVLGRLDGVPVATNIVFNGGGVVGVYGIAVSQFARGKGIGAAITLKLVLEARDKDGFKYAVLSSAEMGVKVYERIGFRMTDVRINRYLWRNV